MNIQKEVNFGGVESLYGMSINYASGKWIPLERTLGICDSPVLDREDANGNLV